MAKKKPAPKAKPASKATKKPAKPAAAKAKPTAKAKPPVKKAAPPPAKKKPAPAPKKAAAKPAPRTVAKATKPVAPKAPAKAATPAPKAKAPAPAKAEAPKKAAPAAPAKAPAAPIATPKAAAPAAKTPVPKPAPAPTPAPVAVKEPAPKAKKEKEVKVKEPVVAVMTGYDPLGGPAKTLKRAMKERYVLEFYLRATPGSLYDLISTPSGFSEWFCDDVDVRGDQFTFQWGPDDQVATCLGRKYGEMIRFHWENDDDPGSFFELRIRIDPMTNETCLVVTDHAWPKDMDESKALWASQIHTLQRVLGA